MFSLKQRWCATCRAYCVRSVCSDNTVVLLCFGQLLGCTTPVVTRLHHAGCDFWHRCGCATMTTSAVCMWVCVDSRLWLPPVVCLTECECVCVCVCPFCLTTQHLDSKYFQQLFHRFSTRGHTCTTWVIYEYHILYYFISLFATYHSFYKQYIQYTLLHLKIRWFFGEHTICKQWFRKLPKEGFQEAADNIEVPPFLKENKQDAVTT